MRAHDVCVHIYFETLRRHTCIIIRNEFSKTTLKLPLWNDAAYMHCEMLGGDAFCYYLPTTIHMIIVSRIFLANFLIKSKFMLALSGLLYTYSFLYILARDLYNHMTHDIAFTGKVKFHLLLLLGSSLSDAT